MQAISGIGTLLSKLVDLLLVGGGGGGEVEGGLELSAWQSDYHLVT